MRCRKNYRDLTPVERDRLVQALYHVKAMGVVDQYAAEHEMHFNHGIHRSSHFLPWHRDFIRRFEDALRTFHPDVTLPYWNSVVDTSAGDPLWDNAFLGQFDAAWGLDRALGSDTLPSQGALDAALGRGDYGAFWPDLETNVHNPPHRWVEGEMGQADSPHDPVFFLHHCWIDLLWAQWQLRNPGAAFVSSGAGLGLNDPMMGVTTTPADVLDHRTINVYHYPAGFQQDAPRITQDSTVVNFLDVPAGETRMAAGVLSLDACETVHFTVVAGPALTSGPAGTVFAAFTPMVAADPHVDPKARVWFTYLGTAANDVATGTVTVRCDETGEDFIFTLTANTIARPSAAIAMVLDCSNSMTFDSGVGAGITRADVLRFSAPTAVIVLEDTHSMSVNTFDHDAHAGIGMTSAAGAGKIAINGAIQSYAPNPNGWTSIGEGVAFAHGIVDAVTNHDVKATIVLTDGQENHGPHARRYIADVVDLVSSLNGRVFAIGLGRAEVLNAAALQALCSGNNGYMLTTGDLTPDASYRLAKYYQQIFAGVTNNEIVLDPEGFVSPGQEVRIPFWLSETDISAKAILLTPAPWAIRYRLETPDGDLIDAGVAAAHPSIEFEGGGQVALYRVGLPVPLGQHAAHAGKWHARLQIDAKGFKRYLGSLDGQGSGQTGAAAHGLRYNFNVHAYSNLRLRVAATQSGYQPGATITLRAYLTEYGVPVVARALCQMEWTRPDASQSVVSMTEVEPGIFEGMFLATLPGVHRTRVIATGKTFRGRPFTREQTLTPAVWQGGDRPPPGNEHDPAVDNQRLCELIGCLLGNKGIVAWFEKQGIDVAQVRRCFAAYCRRAQPTDLPHRAVTLEQRLREIVSDEHTVQALLSVARTTVP